MASTERPPTGRDARRDCDPVMPEVDWLTGLASRAAFVRQVTQSDRDRDPFTVAIIKISDFAELNRQLDYDAGDALLRRIGRTLANQTSVNTIAARLGGAEFGLLAVDIEPVEAARLIGPMAAELRGVITDWTALEAEEAGVPLVEPGLAIGVSSGSSERVWIEAATAAEVAVQEGAHHGLSPVVEYTTNDQRIIRFERQRKADNELVMAISAGRLETISRGIQIARRTDDTDEAQDWTWLRLQAASADIGTIDTAIVGSTTGRRVERWLIEEAVKLIGRATTSLRVTVPISSEAAAGHGLAHILFPIVERYRIPPSRLVFEIDERAISEAGGAHYLIEQLDDLGSSVVIAGCEGGWTTWEVVEAAPVAYLKPAERLVRRAGSGDERAARALATLAANTEDADVELIAPGETDIDGAGLAELGFGYLEEAEQRSIDAAIPSNSFD